MKTTIDFLNAVKATTGAVSDYALAQKLDTSKQSISLYMQKNKPMGNEIALKVAHILGLDPYIVLSAAEVERAKTESEKAAWTALFERCGGLDLKLPASALTRARLGEASYNTSENLYIM